MEDYVKKLAELKVQQDALAGEREANQDKAFKVNMIGALGDALANRQTAGNFWLGKMNPQKNVSGITNQFADNVLNRTKNREQEIARSKDLYDKYQMANTKSKMDFENQKALQSLKNQGTIGAAREKAKIKENEFAFKKAEKDKVLDEELFVPGYQRTGEVRLRPSDASKLRSAASNSEQLVNKLKRYKELVDQVGSFEYGGQEGTEMESLATEIQLLSKAPEMYALGVLTGPDLGLLSKITAQPASMDSLITRDGTRKRQIDAQIKSIEDKLSSIMKTSGYQQMSKDENPISMQNAKKSQDPMLPSANASEIDFNKMSDEEIDKLLKELN